MLLSFYIFARGLKISCNYLILAIFLRSTKFTLLRNFEKFGAAAVRSGVEATMP
jgi:hypothetical protein